MNWSRKRLSEIADLSLGKMLDQNKNKGEPYPYLANINVRWGEFDLADLRQMRFEEREFERYGLKDGDIVMCEGGEPGRCAIWREQVPHMMIQKALHRIRPREVIDSSFLFYALMNKGRNHEFEGLFTGSTIKHFPGEKLALVEVSYPQLDVQRRIADILSAYDDLIENNTRRIQILEEMARALYHEWCVEFRFPGHENVPMVETEQGQVPQGWRSVQLGQLIMDNIGGGWGSDERSEEFSLPAYVIRGTDIPGARVGQTNSCPLRYHKPSNLRSRKINAGNIVFEVSGGSKGQPVGRALLVNERILRKFGEDAICASFCKLIRVGQIASPEFIYLHLDRIYRDGTIDKYQVQSTGITNFKFTSFLTDHYVVLPSADVEREFTDAVTSFLDTINTLGIQNANLRQTRDLLLPKLVSGEIDVSELDKATAHSQVADETRIGRRRVRKGMTRQKRSVLPREVRGQYRPVRRDDTVRTGGTFVLKRKGYKATGRIRRSSMQR